MRTDPSTVIPVSGDPAESWIVFHKALKSWLGKDAANAYFLKFWNQRAGAGSPADTHSLREYMDGQDVDLTTTWKGDVVDTAFSIRDWIADAGKVVGIIILTIAGLVIGLVVYIVVKGTNRITAPKQTPVYPQGFYQMPEPVNPRGINKIKLLP